MIEQSLVDRVIAQAETGVLDEALIGRLRAEYPGVHFTLCMDDDIVDIARPVAGGDLFNLYLVNSSDHCSVLTNDLAAASGIVLAEIIPD